MSLIDNKPKKTTVMKMEIKLSMAILSHLSDAQHEILLGEKQFANKRLNFIKKLIFENKDLDKYVTFEYLQSIFESINENQYN
jgi:hypothetical protein